MTRISQRQQTTTSSAGTTTPHSLHTHVVAHSPATHLDVGVEAAKVHLVFKRELEQLHLPLEERVVDALVAPHLVLVGVHLPDGRVHAPAPLQRLPQRRLVRHLKSC